MHLCIVSQLGRATGETNISSFSFYPAPCQRLTLSRRQGISHSFACRALPSALLHATSILGSSYWEGKETRKSSLLYGWEEENEQLFFPPCNMARKRRPNFLSSLSCLLIPQDSFDTKVSRLWREKRRRRRQEETICASNRSSSLVSYAAVLFPFGFIRTLCSENLRCFAIVSHDNVFYVSRQVTPRSSCQTNEEIGGDEKGERGALNFYGASSSVAPPQGTV